MELHPPIESYRKIFEPEEQWNLRRAFILRNQRRMSRKKLLRMSDMLVNMEFLGHQYRSQDLIQVTRKAGNLLLEFRQENRLAREGNEEYSVKYGLDNFVLIMFRKDRDDIDSGIGLEKDRYKSIIQDSARLCGIYLEVNSKFLPMGRKWETELLLDGRVIELARNKSLESSKDMASELSFLSLMRSQHQIVINESCVSTQDFVLKHQHNTNCVINENSTERHVGFEEMGFGADAMWFCLPFAFSLQVKNYLKNFISERSTDVLVFCNRLTSKQRKIICELAYALNLDFVRIGEGSNIHVIVQHMRCPAILMDLFDLMRVVTEAEDHHPIFEDASLLDPIQ